MLFNRKVQLRHFVAILMLFSVGTAAASPLEQVMTVKDRLRLSLWYEGFDSQNAPKEKAPVTKAAPLPEELERALQKL